MSKPKPAALAKDEVPLPHPAEDLSADDDLLSWILVDQLGCMPNSRLGVHPQENKFVGPAFKTDDVLQIVRETVVLGNVPTGMAKLQDFPLIQAHLAGKQTEQQRERFVQHLRRYLLCYTPTSRIDIHSTDRYTHVTKHPELAVYATRPLAMGAVLQELQGSVVPLPYEWGAEMDLGDNYELARETAGQEFHEGEEEEEEIIEAEQFEVPRRKGKEAERGQRRSDRTRRRDFSIVWSGLKRCYQLFLGPARFLNHDCSPTVELLRQGNHVTFRVIRAVRIGEELTAYYGDNYFGKDNIECLCLSCEQNQRGHFAPKPDHSRSASETRSDISMTPQKPRNRPSNLRREFLESNSSDASASEHLDAGPSAVPSVGQSTTELEEGVGSDADSDSEPVVREKLSRLAKTNAKPWSFLKRHKPSPSDAKSSIVDEDLPEDFPRCGSCTKPLHERMWYAGRYFDHCARCTRHAFIFGLPWPAHRQSEVQEYPPSHLIPSGYLPRKISTIPLPSLQKKKFREVLVEVPPDDPIPVSRDYRRQLRLRKEIAMEDFIVQSLRETAWTFQVAKEDAVLAAAAAAEAKLEARRQAQEEKKRRDANTIKGSGVWSRYEYIDEEELKRRELARNAPTNGTRRAKAVKVDEEDGEREMTIMNGPVPDRSVGVSASRQTQQIAIPTKLKRKRKPLVKPFVPTKTPSTSPTLRLFIGSQNRPDAADPSRKRPAESTSTSPRHKKARADSPAPLLLPPYRRSAPLGASPSKSNSAQSAAETTSTSGLLLKKRGRPKGSGKLQIAAAAAKVQARRVVSVPSSTCSETPTTSSVEIKRRGRPPGSGKHQIAAAKVEAERRKSLLSSVADSSHTFGSPAQPPRIVIKRDRPRVTEPIEVDDRNDLHDEIEVSLETAPIMPAFTPRAVSSISDRSRETEQSSETSGGKKDRSGGSGEKKVRSFFPSHLPILKLGH